MMGVLIHAENSPFLVAVRDGAPAFFVLPFYERAEYIGGA
ncbi:hypothetical protein RSPO_c00301 [Ralstonia solanacearum Po82]|uniref:Uncharacterized protein n=1 Tax=Ralstonia solanacearum (strain Po82) TaxID=1031711 RepID=F6G6R1_RALS8|nr:hypothetical protein RSPO_c00301 [Ralstonia solanacearum Po82]